MISYFDDWHVLEIIEGEAFLGNRHPEEVASIVKNSRARIANLAI